MSILSRQAQCIVAATSRTPLRRIAWRANTHDN
jgi:hypothetical protein